MSAMASEILLYLEKSLDGTILDYKLAPLTAVGENYGSKILSLEIKIKTNGNIITNNKVQTLKLVIKFPVTDDTLTKMFQPTHTCLKENSFYTQVIPELIQLQYECGLASNDMIDIFIQCYGARLSLDPDSEIADENAFLILENIKHSNFRSGNHGSGLDKYETKAVIKNLAKFHGLTLALRLHKPDVFEQRVKPYLIPIDHYADTDNENQMYTAICNRIKRIDEFDDNFRCRLFAHLKVCSDKRRKAQLESDTPYTAVVHSDVWTNNIMLSTDVLGRPDKVKFYDYQLIAYKSVVQDLVFFLFTSCNETVRINHIDQFFEYYHEHFYKTLRLLKCPLDDYTYSKFQLELKIVAKFELEHINYMQKIFLSDRLQNQADLTFDYLIRDDNLHDRFYEVLRNILIDFDRLNFI